MIKIRRRMGRLAAAATAGAAVIAAAGVASAASGAGAGAPQQASTSLAYTCRFPSGPQRVGLRVAARFQAAETVGQVVQPAGVHVTITVPRAALGDLARRDGAKISASATLDVTAAEGGTSASAAWRVAPAQPMSLPPTGRLVLSASGAVPPTTASAPGAVTFTVEGLFLVLAPQHTAGTATTPTALAAACGLTPGQDAQLAAVPVSGSSPSPTASGRTGAGRHPPIAVRRPPRGPGSRAAKSCWVKSPNPWIGSAFIAGFSDVKKLHGAALLGPGPDNRPRAGLTDLNLLYDLFNNCTQTFYSYNTGELNYHGQPQLPPARSTFLTFRFMPVTATLRITVIPTDCRDATGHLIGKVGLCIVLKQVFPSTVEFTKVTSEQQIQVYDVSVNGVPLNVGAHCQTVVPAKVDLTSDAQYDVTQGGVLSGNITIPPFTGCGVGENLDPLLNASISGPGNFVKLTQGPTCAKYLPSGQVNDNCLIPPGQGRKYGVPKYYPKVQH
jgi:hypothetical protein